MVPEGIISIAQIVAEASILVATFVIAIYTLVIPRIPDFRDAITVIIALGKTKEEKESLSKTAESVTRALDVMVYFPLVGSSLSFLLCIVSVDTASGALCIDDLTARLLRIEAAALWLLWAIGFLVVSLALVVAGMKYVQDFIALAEKARKLPPKEFERFRP